MKITAIAAVILCAAGCSESSSSQVSADAAVDIEWIDEGPADTSPPADADANADAVTDIAEADLTEDATEPRLEWESFPAEFQLVDHTATLLDDGRVLITGGEMKPDNGGVTRLSATYLYSPDTNTFVEAGELSEARGSHTATKLADGRVLVAGGEISGGSSTDTVDIFDPSKSGQAAWTVGPPLMGKRDGHEAVLLPNGAVLVIGGYGAGALATLERFEDGSWSALATTMNHSRNAFAATLLGSGKVLAVGGFADGDFVAEIEVYDNDTGQWSDVASLVNPRALHTATLLDDGRVLIVGGNCGIGEACATDELYDPSSDAVSSIGHAGNPPQGHAAAKLLDGRILIVGDQSDRDKVVLFTPSGGGSWTSAPPLLQGRCKHTATLLSDGSVLVVGGQDNYWSDFGPYVESAERFYP